MARYTGPTCKLARREGTDLFLKSGAKPLESKCKFQVPPGGVKSERRQRLSDYGMQLREKQKLRRMYGVLERQFSNYYEEAARRQGATGENLLKLLECRLDNVVYRMGFAATRTAARQMVMHGHVKVNGKRVDIPSFQTKAGQSIELGERAKANEGVKGSVETAAGRGIPKWLTLDAGAFRGQVIAAPTREDVTLEINEQLIVELYSK